MQWCFEMKYGKLLAVGVESVDRNRRSWALVFRRMEGMSMTQY